MRIPKSGIFRNYILDFPKRNASIRGRFSCLPTIYEKTNGMGKRILLYLLFLLIAIGCSHHLVMRYAFDRDYTLWQVDSVCIEEDIPVLSAYDSLWLKNGMLEEGTDFILEYSYIKDENTVYTVVPVDTLYNFKKRITVKVKK